MNKRRIYWFILPILAVLLIAAGALLPFLQIRRVELGSLNSQTYLSTNGASDWNIYLFYMSGHLGNLARCLVVAGVGCLALWAVSFLHHPGEAWGRSTGLSLALSASGGAGLVCLLVWMGTLTPGWAQNPYPIARPVSILGGAAWLVICIALTLAYHKLRSRDFKLRELVADGLTLCVTFIPFYYIWNSLARLLKLMLIWFGI